MWGWVGRWRYYNRGCIKHLLPQLCPHPPIPAVPPSLLPLSPHNTVSSSAGEPLLTDVVHYALTSILCRAYCLWQHSARCYWHKEPLLKEKRETPPSRGYPSSSLSGARPSGHFIRWTLQYRLLMVSRRSLKGGPT